MNDDGPQAQRRLLGDFLRAQREKLAPEAAGIIPGGRRRTPGLRREEVAQLCGLSATWYSWIEQGREVAASPMALARIAAALRLGRAERAYLFELAGRRDPQHGAAPLDEIPATATALLCTIDAPAYLLDRAWNGRYANPQAERLFTGWLDRPGDRNLLRFIFFEPGARRLIVDWEERARRVVAEFRAHCGAHLDDPDLRRLVQELQHGSREFDEFWNRHGVLAREGGLRRFDHPEDGPLQFEQVTLELTGHPDTKLTVLLPLSGGHPPAQILAGAERRHR
jgi:transcriptional regulator with XRE-family HTH domain